MEPCFSTIYAMYYQHNDRYHSEFIKMPMPNKNVEGNYRYACLPSGTFDVSFPIGYENECSDKTIVKFKNDIGSKGYMIEFQNNILQFIQVLQSVLQRKKLQYDVSDKVISCGCRNNYY